MKAAGPPVCLGVVVALSISVLLGTYYLESVHLPQGSTDGDQNADIADLRETIRHLREGDAVLKERLLVVETALRQAGVDPRELAPAPAVVSAPVAASKTAELPEVGFRGGAPAAAKQSTPLDVIPKRTSGSLAAAAAAAATATPARWRADLKCGKPWIAYGNLQAECDPVSDQPCCAPSGWCGGTPEHCLCDGCNDFRLGQTAATSSAAVDPVMAVSTVLWRNDTKCGAQWLVNGVPAQCNPRGATPCCGSSGWCGDTLLHCDCPGCQDFRPSSRHAVTPGSDSGYSVSSLKRIGLVVPFRDREVHIEGFRKRIEAHVKAWNAKGVKHDWWIFVVEQFDNKDFNRGYLFNVGLRFAMDIAEEDGTPFDCVVMHDIDIIPTPVVDYGFCPYPNQLSGEIECWSWSVPYPDNVGGVVSLSPAHWQGINGFSNEYEGWGGEDDDLYLRLKQNSLLKGGCHTFCKNPPKVPIVYRPPLGTGRFNCMHDGDHTPRQRAPDSTAMWQRLDAMKKSSKRWTKDGLNSLKVHSASPPLQVPACERCENSEGVLGKALFSEHWSMVSSRPLALSQHIGLGILDNVNCTSIDVPVAELLQGIAHLRSHLPRLFAGVCRVDPSWASSANFVLVDVTLGQTMLIGEGAGWAAPDGSLPHLEESSVDMKDRGNTAIREAGSPFLQARRLIRWIRLLPQDHRGRVIATAEPLEKLRQRFVREERQMPQISPACVSKAKTKGGPEKFRVTPGTLWCGDQGWDHVENFQVLRSMTTIPQDKLVPICISLNKKLYTYRFENSEGGCVGAHSSGTIWEHQYTIHSSKDASGSQMCVGVHEAGAQTMWTLRKQASCSFGKYKHSFAFAAMDSSQHIPPLVHACLLSSTTTAGHGSGSAEGRSVTIKRLAVGETCKTPPANWKLELELEFLARSTSPKDHQICGAYGQPGGSQSLLSSIFGSAPIGDAQKRDSAMWQFFSGGDCKRRKVSTGDDKLSPVDWTMDEDSTFYVPDDATGWILCQCRVDVAGADGLTHRFFSWSKGSCPADQTEESRIRELSGADILRFTYLVNA